MQSNWCLKNRVRYTSTDVESAMNAALAKLEADGGVTPTPDGGKPAKRP